MLDINRLEEYKENNRIEAKKALGGLPHSIWETYSAFANTMGGVILLGVEEYRDKTFHPVDLPDPEGMTEKFFSVLNDTRFVSKNILSPADVTIHELYGKRIISIQVPRAPRADRPIFLNGDTSLCYRRNGEGDYKCTPEQINAMLRDSKRKTQDMHVLTDCDLSVLSRESVVCYRSLLHSFASLSDEELLIELGAAAVENGILHPTAAGLLMFAPQEKIKEYFPMFSLEYDIGASEFSEKEGLKTGNLFEFYFSACRHLAQTAATLTTSPEELSRLCIALREALVNCIVNADYRSPSCVSVKLFEGNIVFSNSGNMRITPNHALLGGISDPRNGVLAEMFRLISVGKRAGSGIPSIYKLWKRQGLANPALIEHFSPDRIDFYLPISSLDGHTASTQSHKMSRPELHMAAVVSFLTESIRAQSVEIAELLGINQEQATELLEKMTAQGILSHSDDGFFILKA